MAAEEEEEEAAMVAVSWGRKEDSTLCQMVPSKCVSLHIFFK